MSLIFNALQRFGQRDRDPTVEQNAGPPRRNALTWRGIFLSPATILTMGGLLVVAGILTVEAGQYLSARAVSGQAVTRPVHPPEEVVPAAAPDAVKSAGETIIDPASGPVAGPVNASDSSMPEDSATVELHASGSSEPSGMQFFPPEPSPAGAGGSEQPAAVQDAEIPARFVTADRTTAPLPEPAAARTIPRPASAPDGKVEFNQATDSYRGIPALAMRSAAPATASGIRKGPDHARPATSYPDDSGHRLAFETHQRQAAQAARHLSIARLVNQIRGAIQSEDHGVVAGLLDQLEELQGRETIFADKLRAYWRIRQGNLAQARVLLQKVLSQQPDDRESGLNMAVIDMRTGRYAEARQGLEHLQSLYPEDSEIALSLRQVTR